MRIEVPYGDVKEIVDVPDENLGEVVYQKDLIAHDKFQVVLDAINKPTDSEPLADFLRGANDVVVIVNDATRPTPTWRILKVIMPLLEGRSVRYIVATGMHRTPTPDEYKFIFGDLYESIKARVFAHDSKNSEMSDLGVTKNGTRLMMNKMVVDADRIIVISSVEPHYFAGYTGGRKSFLPGVSAYETIEQNHRLALSIKSQSLKLQGNPVAEDMEEAVRALSSKRIFSIMVVLDKNHRTCCAFAGNIESSWRSAVRMADEVFVIDLKRKSDIVVAVTAFPYDIDLYQSQKALDNAKYAVRDGGVIILVSACRDGIGPPTFLNLLGSAGTPKEVLEKISQGYKLGYHKAAKMAEIGSKCRMMAVTKLDPEVTRKAHMAPMNTVQEAVDAAIKELGPDSKVTFIMDAVITVPRIRKT